MCVSARRWKREEIDQHREERVHQQRLDGGCEERERGKERARAVAADSCCSISLWASSCRQGVTDNQTRRQVQTWCDGRGRVGAGGEEMEVEGS